MKRQCNGGNVRWWRLSPVATGLVAALATSSLSLAQRAPDNGPRQVDPRWHALQHATLIVRPGETIDDATIVIRDGMIVSVEAGADPPEGARVWDYTGLRVYAGLIESHVPVEAPAPETGAPGSHWNNDKVRPQRSALDGPGVEEKLRKELRSMGFVAAAIAPKGGVFTGSGAVVSLSEPGDFVSASTPEALNPEAFQEVSFKTGGFRDTAYPSSLMGVIAVVRQALLDADWYARSLRVVKSDVAHHEPLARNDALAAIGPNGPGATPLLFNAVDELDVLRAAKIAREFDRPYLVLGSGDEYRRLRAIVDDRTSLIVPLAFPTTPEVKTIAGAESVTLRELMAWEQAPTNLRRLDEAGVRVALTTDKLKKRDDFLPNLREAIEQGLTEDSALAMLTTNPASMLGVADRLGAVAPGMIASLVAVDGSLFDEDAEVRDVWVSGRRYEINKAPAVQIVGAWTATFGDEEPLEGELVIAKGDKITIKALDAESKASSTTLRNNRLNFVVEGAPFDAPGMWTLAGLVEGDRIFGTVVGPDGDTMPWSAVRASESQGDDASSDADTDDDAAGDDDDADSAIPDELPTPMGAYGLLTEPEQRDMVVTGATIWTQGDAGILENGAIVVTGGKVSYVGPAATAPSAPGALRIDATGKHITPGLIDAHSHTGISRGVNEGTQAVTSEVRIFDVINPDAINIYRELAGGLTVMNQLHGSANPIGGQNSVVKLRWGVDRPDDMRFQGASPGIKFALGENVKQSNWGEKFTTRYPQTRMGVETLIRDRFTAAREYEEAMERYNALRSDERARTEPPRRDLELDALVEVLNGKRLVHSHSYRQDEILMLTRVARDFGFKIGTFQHVLEGYKVADAIRDYAIGGSTFSDWWAYKFEVYDAIPYNGAIMHDVGVVVSFNSDSDELARRLNTEAAKAVKYGGVDPQEALKFVTLNPAKQLRIDDHVGSVEVGKDADFVIWSGDPLSAFTRCEATYIDGREYFSLDRDKKLRQWAQKQRSRIIQKILAESGDGKDKGKGEMAGHKDSPGAKPVAAMMSQADRRAAAARERYFLELLRSGFDPESSHPGACGLRDAQYSGNH